MKTILVPGHIPIDEIEAVLIKSGYSLVPCDEGYKITEVPVFLLKPKQEDQR